MNRQMVDEAALAYIRSKGVPNSAQNMNAARDLVMRYPEIAQQYASRGNQLLGQLGARQVEYPEDIDSMLGQLDAATSEAPVEQPTAQSYPASMPLQRTMEALDAPEPVQTPRPTPRAAAPSRAPARAPVAAEEPAVAPAAAPAPTPTPAPTSAPVEDDDGILGMLGQPGVLSGAAVAALAALLMRGRRGAGGVTPNNASPTSPIVGGGGGGGGGLALVPKEPEPLGLVPKAEEAVDGPYQTTGTTEAPRTGRASRPKPTAKTRAVPAAPAKAVTGGKKPPKQAKGQAVPDSNAAVAAPAATGVVPASNESDPILKAKSDVDKALEELGVRTDGPEQAPVVQQSPAEPPKPPKTPKTPKAAKAPKNKEGKQPPKTEAVSEPPNEQTASPTAEPTQPDATPAPDSPTPAKKLSSGARQNRKREAGYALRAVVSDPDVSVGVDGKVVVKDKAGNVLGEADASGENWKDEIAGLAKRIADAENSKGGAVDTVDSQLDELDAATNPEAEAAAAPVEEAPAKQPAARGRKKKEAASPAEEAQAPAQEVKPTQIPPQETPTRRRASRKKAEAAPAEAPAEAPAAEPPTKRGRGRPKSTMSLAEKQAVVREIGEEGLQRLGLTPADVLEEDLTAAQIRSMRKSLDNARREMSAADARISDLERKEMEEARKATEALKQERRAQERQDAIETSNYRRKASKPVETNDALSTAHSLAGFPMGQDKEFFVVDNKVIMRSAETGEEVNTGKSTKQFLTELEQQRRQAMKGSMKDGEPQDVPIEDLEIPEKPTAKAEPEPEPEQKKGRKRSKKEKKDKIDWFELKSRPLEKNKAKKKPEDDYEEDYGGDATEELLNQFMRNTGDEY